MTNQVRQLAVLICQVKLYKIYGLYTSSSCSREKSAIDQLLGAVCMKTRRLIQIWELLSEAEKNSSIDPSSGGSRRVSCLLFEREAHRPSPRPGRRLWSGAATRRQLVSWSKIKKRCRCFKKYIKVHLAAQAVRLKEFGSNCCVHTWEATKKQQVLCY